MSDKCNWCKTQLNPGAIRCKDCQLWQGAAAVFAAVTSMIRAFLVPLAIVVVTLLYQHRNHEQDLETQQSNRAQDAARTRLDQTFKDVKAIVDMLGDWQANYDSLMIDCEPDHREDNDKCLADYTRRLAKIDAYIAQVSWAVGASALGNFARSCIRALNDAWWAGRTGARDIITSKFGHLAIRTGKSAIITTADTSYDDYNRLVLRCEGNWSDPNCPSLQQCQKHGFEHSECVKEIGDAIASAKLDDLSRTAFCAIVMSLDATRFQVMHELDASPTALATYKTHLCDSPCYKNLSEEQRNQFTEAKTICSAP